MSQGYWYPDSNIPYESKEVADSVREFYEDTGSFFLAQVEEVTILVAHSVTKRNVGLPILRFSFR